VLVVAGVAQQGCWHPAGVQTWYWRF
jgi:hypothetical protein